MKHYHNQNQSAIHFLAPFSKIKVDKVWGDVVYFPIQTIAQFCGHFFK